MPSEGYEAESAQRQYLRSRSTTATVNAPMQITMIAFRGASAALIPNSTGAFSAAAKLSPKIILWADIVMTGDDQIIVSEEKTFDRGGVPTLVSFQKYSELPKLQNGEPIPKLIDLLQKFCFLG